MKLKYGRTIPVGFALFVSSAFVTMMLVKHDDAKPENKDILEYLGTGELK